MELVRGLHNIRDRHKGCVLTIGKFDGVHLGHQQVLAQMIERARELALPATVMVFEPQPEEFFAPDKAPARLSRLADKYRQLKALGIDRLICVKFNADFANQSAEDFVHHWLVDKLGVRFLVVGDDFRFGKARQGDFAMLNAAGKRLGFQVVSTQSYRLADCRISSSAIREALARGDLANAEKMLGHPYAIAGRVVHGDKKGRTIGFPTANILLKRHKAPVAGVFAVRVWWQNKPYMGVANVGNRPTVQGTRTQLEVHLFDFDQQLYGQPLVVELMAKLRDERQFDSFVALTEQIQQDAQRARKWFAPVED